MATSNPEGLRRHLPSLSFVVVVTIVLVFGLGAFVVSGVYNIAADAHHTAPVYWTMETLRDRSIAAHARGVRVPRDLNSPQRISVGAGLYAGMCVSCHLGPGVEPTEISQGLYPAAPRLSLASDKSPAEQFWMIKHGVKMSAMPAWGRTHSDTLMWDMVAFVQTLPHLSASQYAATIKAAPVDHDEMMAGDNKK